MSQPKILAAMISAIETFARLSIDYYVGGAVASLVHGMCRMTADVDIVAEMK